jgi:hypothetical protein
MASCVAYVAIEPSSANSYVFRRGGKSVGKSNKSLFFIGEFGGHRLRQRFKEKAPAKR